MVFAVMAIWGTAEKYIEASSLFWAFLGMALSVGGAALVESTHWWWGFGLWGLAIWGMRLGDLLLVVTDRVRVTTLEKRGGIRP